MKEILCFDATSLFSERTERNYFDAKLQKNNEQQHQTAIKSSGQRVVKKRSVNIRRQQIKVGRATSKISRLGGPGQLESYIAKDVFKKFRLNRRRTKMHVSG